MSIELTSASQNMIHGNEIVRQLPGPNGQPPSMKPRTQIFNLSQNTGSAAAAPEKLPELEPSRLQTDPQTRANRQIPTDEEAHPNQPTRNKFNKSSSVGFHNLEHPNLSKSQSQALTKAVQEPVVPAAVGQFFPSL